MNTTYTETVTIYPNGKYYHPESIQEVDVILWDGNLESEKAISELIGKELNTGESPDILMVPTSQGEMQGAEIGEYIVKFPNGEVYVIMNRIFEMLFKPIEQSKPKIVQCHVDSLPSELKGNISDGYHTFNELYDHRITLFIALCNQLNSNSGHNIWRSHAHSDGAIWDGWFILGIDTEPGKQITYHLPISKWRDCNFAITLISAPKYDGHTSADVLERLKYL